MYQAVVLLRQAPPVALATNSFLMFGATPMRMPLTTSPQIVAAQWVPWPLMSCAVPKAPLGSLGEISLHDRSRHVGECGM